MKILVLYKALWGQRELKQSVLDHLRMFDAAVDGKEVIYWNIADGVPAWLSRVECDAVVLHTTLLSVRYGAKSLYEYFRKQLKWMESDTTIKIAFPQDERYFSSYLQDWLNSLAGVVHLYSIFGARENTRLQIYPQLSSEIKIYPCLTGYISQRDLSEPTTEFNSRNYDVLYRAKKLPPWVGRYGQLKTKIAEELKRVSNKLPLKINSSVETSDILLGRNWIQAMRDSKYLIACEAGGSAHDPEGQITEFANKIKAHKGRFPSFAEIDDQFSTEWDGHDFRAMGPKNLEAAASKTCQILVEGEYGGILVPHRHYIPIKEDLSDLAEVLAALTDSRGHEVAERAYKEIALEDSFSYRGFASEVVANVSKEIPLDTNTSRPKTSSFFTQFCASLNGVCDRFPRLFSLPHLAKLWLIQTIAGRSN